MKYQQNAKVMNKENLNIFLKQLEYIRTHSKYDLQTDISLHQKITIHRTEKYYVCNLYLSRQHYFENNVWLCLTFTIDTVETFCDELLNIIHYFNPNATIEMILDKFMEIKVDK